MGVSNTKQSKSLNVLGLLINTTNFLTKRGFDSTMGRSYRRLKSKITKKDTLIDKNRFSEIQMVVLGENTSSCSHYFSLLFFLLKFSGSPFLLVVYFFLYSPSLLYSCSFLSWICGDICSIRLSWLWRQTFGVFLLFKPVIQHLMGLTLGRERLLM